MTPMVPMKSSTGIPLRTWTFLKTCSEVCRLACDAACGAANVMPANHRTVPPAITRISLDQCFIRVLTILLRRDVERGRDLEGKETTLRPGPIGNRRQVSNRPYKNRSGDLVLQGVKGNGGSRHLAAEE